jgi:hypothetical protein
MCSGVFFSNQPTCGFDCSGSGSETLFAAAIRVPYLNCFRDPPIYFKDVNSLLKAPSQVA